MNPKIPAFGCGGLALLTALGVTIGQCAGILGLWEEPLDPGKHLLIWVVEAIPLTVVGVVLVGLGGFKHRRDRQVARAREWMACTDRFTVAALAAAHGWSPTRAAREVQSYLELDNHADLVFHRAAGEWLNRGRIAHPDSRVVRACATCGAPQALLILPNEQVACDHCGTQL